MMRSYMGGNALWGLEPIRKDQVEMLQNDLTQTSLEVPVDRAQLAGWGLGHRTLASNHARRRGGICVLPPALD